MPATTRSDIDRLAGDSAGLDELLRDLASQTAAGSRDALDLLLYAIDSQRLAEPGIRRVVFDPNDVDDVQQNVLIAIAESVGSWRGEGRFTSWLYSVARNKALEHLRRKKETAELPTELGEAHRISSLIANEISVRGLLAELPTHYASAVTLRDLEGLSYADIADRLDLNLNTVRAHISRGRALLASAASEAALGGIAPPDRPARNEASDDG